MSTAPRMLVLALLSLGLGSGCGIRSLLSPEGNDEIPGPGEVAAGSDGDAGVGPACGQGKPCDPANLGGETCGTLGAGNGRLGCDPDTCTFDTSMCTGGSVGMGGTGAPPIFGGGALDGGPGFFGPVPDGGPGFFGPNPGGGGNPDDDGGTPTDGGVPTGQPPVFGGGFFGGGGAPDGGGFFGGGFFGGGGQ